MTPDQIQVSMTFITTPWDVKILYGIISDTVKLPFFAEAPKKGYIILFSLINVICLACNGLITYESSKPLMMIFFVSNVCGAFTDCVIDGITTI